MALAMELDRWHSMLNSRFVCERCLTRFYKLYTTCPACKKMGTVRRLNTMLYTAARSEDELRTMIRQGGVAKPVRAKVVLDWQI